MAPLLILGPPCVAMFDVPAWDLALALVGAGIGLAAGRGGPRWAAGFTMFFLLADALGRVALPPPPRFHDPEVTWPGVKPVGQRRLGDVACDRMAGRTDHPPTATDHHPAVLHLGDSMLVFGSDGPDNTAPDDERFPQLVGRQDPGRAHLNLGVAGTSADAHLAIARAWLARGPTAAVVSYVFFNNDLSELGRPLPCCLGPPVDLDAPGAPPRCGGPPAPLLGWSRLDDVVHRSHDPLALRLLTGSPTWGHLRARASWLGPRSPFAALADNDDTRVVGEQARAAGDALRRMLTATRDAATSHGARHVVVILPAAGDGPLRPPDRTDTLVQDRAAGLLGDCDALGLTCLDAWPFIAGAEGCPPEWFLPDRYHLSNRGHRELAAWLGPRLLPLLAEDKDGRAL